MTIVVDCWNDMIEKIKTIPEFVDKTEPVWSEADLIRILKGAKSPMVGVVYGGMTAGSDVSRQGINADLTITLILIVEGNVVGGLDEKPEAARLLDLIRDKMLLHTSPTGHKWRFVREIPRDNLNNRLVFMQTWATSNMLTNKVNLRQ